MRTGACPRRYGCAVPDPTETGRRVLAALERGREKVLEQRRQRLEVLARLVAYEVRREKAAGYPERGRAARIARRLANAAPERTIQRVYASLSRVAESSETMNT